ncbi:site-specific integrase [Gordonia polyisoprenivorans]|uniref:site-specific integrase n=1 Tax=Gordonia polyisoprenivorans TaxID=84595 RepID=UPI0022FFF3CB|nr:site-specific integrase [Gordonia polyisoprenivorans]WCB39481.1 site-specific integrase [Gordonia polyisoprenivorans]
MAVHYPTPRTGKPLNRISINNILINLHCFFDRITYWDYPNAPRRPLVFIGDFPIIDKPLPRFLDDGAATKLLRAARADPDPLSRLIVELLARTGIRRSELLGLTTDAVVQIGTAFWLRIPLGKMHNDRYIHCTPNSKSSSTTGSRTIAPTASAPAGSSWRTIARSAATA